MAVVKLIKEAYFNLKDDKGLRMKFSDFMVLSGVTAPVPVGKAPKETRQVRLFDGKDDIKACVEREGTSQFDFTEDVRLLEGGKVCIFLREEGKDYGEEPLTYLKGII